MTGEEFKARRLAAGWKTQVVVAYDIGVKPQTVKSWENNTNKIPGYAIKWLQRTEKRKGR